MNDRGNNGMTEKTSFKDIAGITARLALGGVFIYAGWLKAVAPAEEFAYAIETYKVVPPGLAMLAAQAVPWIEIYFGMFLAAGVFVRYSAFCLGAAVIGFEALLLQAIIRKLPVTSCGCFGSSHNNSLQYEFYQNLVLLALALPAWKYGGKYSIDSLAERLSGPKTDTPMQGRTL